MRSNTLNILRLSLIFTVVTTATAAATYKFTPDKNLGISIRVAERSDSKKTLEWQYLKVNNITIGPTLDRRDTFGDGVHTGVWLSGDTKAVLIYFAAASERGSQEKALAFIRRVSELKFPTRLLLKMFSDTLNDKVFNSSDIEGYIEERFVAE